MAKSDKDAAKEQAYVEALANSKVLPVEVEGELKKSFIAYAMAVNVSRAIPDVRDGLKPVHRRILYSMSELGLTNDKPFRKCATIVGDVLGKYHPHGDSSVYDALVRLGQSFSIRCPLIDGHGNFGSVDGDPPAAYRYTEARLSKIANEMTRDIDKKTVDFYPNFDDTREQPTVLPSRFPNVLVNGSDGIAVGMATSIPPHNLGDVIDGTVALLNNPEMDVDELMQYIPAPDFPTGALVMGLGTIRDAYRTGKGSAVIRSRAEIEEMGNGKSKIIITEIPYQVNKAELIKAIADQVKDKKIEGIADIQEESDRTGMRIVIETKKDANAQVVLNTLYKQTALQTSFSIILLVLVDGRPKICNLKEVLSKYIEHQYSVIVRRTQFDLDKATERAHILEGLAKAIQDIDAVIELLKKCRDREEGINKLMEAFELDQVQATAVIEMRLQRLTGLELEKILDEIKEKHEEIDNYNHILASKEAQRDIIVSEMLEIKDKYNEPRRSELSYDFDGGIDNEDLIPRKDIVVSLTHEGYVKRQDVNDYQSQHRGGKGIKAHKTKEEDFIERIFNCNTHQPLMLFTNFGRVFQIKGYEIPEAARTARGRALINIVQLDPGERVQAFLPSPEEKEGYFLMLATKNGLIKKTPLEEFASIKRNGKRAITFVDDDQLVEAVITSGNDELIIASSEGYCIHFNENTIRPMGRTAQGVKSIRIPEGEHVVDMTVVKEDSEILTISANGFGKRSQIADYPLQGRNGKGVKAGVFSEATGPLVCLKVIPQDTDVMMITDDAEMIRVDANEITKMGRPTKGVIVKRTDSKSSIVSVALTPHVEFVEDDVNIDEEAEGEENAENAESTDNNE